MQDNNITLRKLKDSLFDYKLLEKWYQQKEIYLYFEQRKLNIEEIKKKYYPRTLKDTNVPVYIIEYKSKPIGIIQYALIDNNRKLFYEINKDNCYELDIFIGEIRYHGRGIGTKVIELLSKYLFENKEANLLIMCPLKENEKAIKCYKKCGFFVKKDFTEKDTIGNYQEYYLMIKEKNNMRKDEIIYERIYI